MLTTAVAVVVVVYLVVQTGPGEQSSIWLINEGREYIEAPRWADIGIVVCMLVFFYTWAAFFEGQTQPWFVQGMQWRMIFGVVMTAGLVLLLWDMLTIGRGETRPAKEVHAPEARVG